MKCQSMRVAGGLLLSGLLVVAAPSKTPVPGTVNYLEGQATVNGQPLTSQSIGTAVVESGQTLDTQNGKVEVLLTPGVFLRLRENSEARMVSSGLADVEVALARGEAAVEADYWSKDNRLRIDENQTRVDILKKGLYVLNAGQPFVQVLDGKANVIFEEQSVNAGKDREVIVDSAGRLKAQDFNNKAVKETALVRWSSLRSQYEAQANLDAARTVVINNGWYGPGWYWGPAFGYWSFLPANGFLYSPFGWGFYSPPYVYSYAGPGFFRPGFHGYYGHGFATRGFVARPGGIAATGRHR
jgi:hypothetical protein